MAAGKISIQANDGKIASVGFEDGASSNVEIVIPKGGGKLANESYVNNKPSGFKNYLINGNFDLWEYATSQNVTGYGSDNMWTNNNVGTTKIHTQVIPTTEELDKVKSSFMSQTSVTSVAGAGNQCLKAQRIENVVRTANKVMTVSFWAKADANKNIAIELFQYFGSGGTPSDTVTGIGSQLIALTTTLTKYSVTIPIPSVGGKTIGTDRNDYLSLVFWFDAGSNFNTRAANLGQQSGTFTIAGVQLEDGDTATAFEDIPPNLLRSMCRYYYKKMQANLTCYGTAGSTIKYFIPFEMRVTPTVSNIAGSVSNCSNFTVTTSSIGGCVVSAVVTETGTASFGYTFDLSAVL